MHVGTNACGRPKHLGSTASFRVPLSLRFSLHHGFDRSSAPPPSAIEAASTAAAGVDLVAAPTTPTSVPTATSPDEPPPKGVEGNALQLTS